MQLAHAAAVCLPHSRLRPHRGKQPALAGPDFERIYAPGCRGLIAAWRRAEASPIAATGFAAVMSAEETIAPRSFSISRLRPSTWASADLV